MEGLARARGGRGARGGRAALADPEPAVRNAAAEGLGRAGAPGRRAARGRRAGLRRRDAGVAIALARALGETGSAGARGAVGLLEGPAAGAAAAAIAANRAPAAGPLDRPPRRGRTPGKVEALEALGQLASKEAGDAIAALLSDDREVRAAAARALGRLRYEPASDRLEALRVDYDGRVRRAAIEALAKLPGGRPMVR